MRMDEYKIMEHSGKPFVWKFFEYLSPLSYETALNIKSVEMPQWMDIELFKEEEVKKDCLSGSFRIVKSFEDCCKEISVEKSWHFLPKSCSNIYRVYIFWKHLRNLVA